MKNKGVTIMELLLVLFILAILASGSIFGFRAFNIKASENSCKTRIRMILAAADAYRSRFRAYPVNIKALVDSGYLVEPNPTQRETSAVKSDWDYYLQSTQPNWVRIDTYGRANTVVAERRIYVIKSIASNGTITYSSYPEDWHLEQPFKH